MTTPEQASKNSSQLLGLPAELNTHIFDLLPFPTLQVLHATHPRFREVIDLEPSKYCQHHHLLHYAQDTHTEHFWKPPYSLLMDGMLHAAKSDPFLGGRELKPCAYCLRLRSIRHFSKHNMKPKRDYNAFCIDCGLNPKYDLYHPGTRCDTKTEPGIYCGRCCVFREGDDALIVGEYNLICRRCGEIADRPRRLKEEREREEEARRGTAARKTDRCERNARLTETTAGSDYDKWKSDSTVEETPIEVALDMIQSAAWDHNYD
ncbi:hypothetical protein MMC15_006854 [Xylographa vitiligo]|nr:hypothetical protein [Xylographa vitiligo]